MTDQLGRRRIFVAGLAVFTGASFLAGAAQGAGLLIAARAVQGFGAALIAPAALSLVAVTFAEGPAVADRRSSAAPPDEPAAQPPEFWKTRCHPRPDRNNTRSQS